jgi:hypothetical protein
VWREEREGKKEKESANRMSLGTDLEKPNQIAGNRQPLLYQSFPNVLVLHYLLALEDLKSSPLFHKSKKEKEEKSGELYSRINILKCQGQISQI